MVADVQGSTTGTDAASREPAAEASSNAPAAAREPAADASSRASSSEARSRAWWLSIQAVPPTLAGPILARPRLEHLLDEATSRRLTVLVGGAGAGKSTLLAGWAGRRRAAWYTLTASDRDLTHLGNGLVGSLSLRVPALSGAVGMPIERSLGPQAGEDEPARARASAAVVADALASVLTRDLVLILDDFAEVAGSNPGTSFIEALCRQAPARLHLIIATREPLPFSIERLRGQGEASVISGSQLAFDRGEIESVVAAGLGSASRDLVREFEAVTGGWPVAVRLAIEALVDVPDARRGATLRGFARPSGAIHDYLADEVLGREPPEVRLLLEAVVHLPRFDAELCAALGLEGADRIIRSLDERGLFIRSIGEGGWYALHPLVKEHLVAGPPSDDHRLADAARWFEAHGDARGALAVWSLLDDPAGTARVLERQGGDLLVGGDVELVASVAADLPEDRRSPTIDRLEGQARLIRGEWSRALACFQRSAGDVGPVDAAVAWRMGLIHHLRGELGAALASYERGVIDPGSPTPDGAQLLAWQASALWLRGEAGACRAKSSEALSAAIATGDDGALAAAHTIAAMVAALDGDRRANDAHYLRALEHANRRGSVLQVIRIRTNRGSRFVEEGYYDEALDELQAAIALAEVTGFAAFHALALSNRGEALRRLGRLDEAIVDLEASRELYQRIESRLVSYPLAHLGDVHTERGAYAIARSLYQEALVVADEPHDVQGLRPALSGLAESLAVREPERALELAERAVALGPGIGLVRALLARGRVAVAVGDLATARAAASAASEDAGARRDRAGLAEALTLEAEISAGSDPAGAIARLDEALLIWRDVRADVAAARVELRRAEIAGMPLPSAALDALAAAGATRHRDARPPDRQRTPGTLGPTPVEERPIIRTFGGFEVIRDGRTVQTAEWGSRKARDLLKILITRRDQHVPRDTLIELLWPGESDPRTSRRLSAVISTARAVLDPDHRCPSGRFVAADRAAVWLERPNLRIDLDAFLADASIGLAGRHEGRSAADAILRRAEATYRGDYLVEDQFEDWSAGVREECRASYAAVAHALAVSAADAGDHSTAARYLRRILEGDEFDERAHLSLVGQLMAAGQPLDARRAYAAYLARMEELGVEAAPFPG